MVINPLAHCGAHRHTNANETVMVTEGDIDIRLTDIRVRLQAGDHQVIPAGTPHEIINRGKTPARLTLIYSAPERAFEALDWATIRRSKKRH